MLATAFFRITSCPLPASNPKDAAPLLHINPLRRSACWRQGSGAQRAALEGSSPLIPVGQGVLLAKNIFIYADINVICGDLLNHLSDDRSDTLFLNRRYAFGKSCCFQIARRVRRIQYLCKARQSAPKRNRVEHQ